MNRAVMAMNAERFAVLQSQSADIERPLFPLWHRARDVERLVSAALASGEHMPRPPRPVLVAKRIEVNGG